MVQWWCPFVSRLLISDHCGRLWFPSLDFESSEEMLYADRLSVSWDALTISTAGTTTLPVSAMIFGFLGNHQGMSFSPLEIAHL